jgi:cytochrome c peroxidase
MICRPVDGLLEVIRLVTIPLILSSIFLPGSGARADTTNEAPIVPLPTNVAVSPEKAALGKRLFNDPNLSHDQRESCATCHPLDHDGVDRMPRALSMDKSRVLRNTPTVFNAAFNFSFNWDGSASSLEAQAEGVILDRAQFGTTWPELLGRLQADPSYLKSFGSVYPDGVTRWNVLDTLARYQSTLITPNSRFDKFLRGQRDVLSADEQEGFRLFKSYGCVACHQGVNVGGNLFQKFGVFQDPQPDRPANLAPDLGRYGLTGDPLDREVFRVPSLRNVALTGPYFHDGREQTLEGAVRTMARAQLGRRLTARETDLIAGFLRTLTGEFDGKPLDKIDGERR